MLFFFKMEIVGISDSQTLVCGTATVTEQFPNLQVYYICVSGLRPRHQVMLRPSQDWEPRCQMVS